jgi:UDP-N-acetylglucosamine--N-acetylmuramyl-(pentapeptide) pyrophosphoryl-undecaprenol N-acetylglucosamine transferase
VVPATSVAAELGKLSSGADFLFVGTGRPAEAEILGPLGYRQKVLKVKPLVGKSPLKVLGAVFSLFTSLIRAVDLVRKHNPDMCLTFGGYVCGPVGLAAKIMGRPLVIHEQNCAPGLTNRWLSRLADLVMVGFPETEESFKAKRVVFTGNPIREDICRLAEAVRVPGKPPKLLAVGGSQGSKRLNLAVMALAENLQAKGVDFSLTHQTGSQMEAEVAARYRDLGLGERAQARAFISDMAGAYAQADLAITRAGALTASELLAAKLPAILVPLPTAAGDHQTANAKALAKLGLARLVPEAELDYGALERVVLELLEGPDKLREMSQTAEDSAKTAASVAPTMAGLCLETLKECRRAEAARLGKASPDSD